MIVKAPIKYPDMDPPVSPACVSAVQGVSELTEFFYKIKINLLLKYLFIFI